MLPLACVASVVTALEDGPTGFTANRRVDAAGYESDGGEEIEVNVNLPAKDVNKLWKWRFSKSPLGELRACFSLPSLFPSWPLPTNQAHGSPFSTFFPTFFPTLSGTRVRRAVEIAERRGLAKNNPPQTAR